ncbi:MAG TPA: DUF6600 domain-containing protein [Thermoanaerobaculia bacterium]|nr:DUF6600 domain-containing protein [Thermoanaerobaculia bacterium]
MSSKQVALLALLAAVAGGRALCAQPQYGNQPPPPDQYSQPQDQYSQPQDQYAQAPVRGAVDINFFYNKLSPYGHWVQRGGYGWVFLPFGVRAGWRPYTLGHWVMTDYGWTWMSDEQFGWATYHYGRWVPDSQYGWGWVPGYEWGPAWVAWRTGGGYIGWAPLPPEVRFRAGIGLDFGGVDVSVSLGPSHYCFVQERSFLASHLATYAVPQARNVTIIDNTNNITDYRVVNNRVFNQGVAVQRVEQVTGQRVQSYQVAAVTAGSARNPQVRGNQLTVFSPNVISQSARRPPPPSVRATGSPTALARQHQQEVQGLQSSQAQERNRLQQLHQTDLLRSQGGSASQQAQQQRQQPQPAQQGRQAQQRQRQAQQQQDQAQQQQDQAQQQQQQQQQQRQPAQRGRQAQQQQAQQQQAQQQQRQQPQPAQQRQADNSQQIQQQHQAELQAQQQQHQREQQQLQARHQVEQQAAPQRQQQGGQRQGGQKAQNGQKQPQARPGGSPPPR